jgi:hypothetical protein
VFLDTGTYQMFQTLFADASAGDGSYLLVDFSTDLTATTIPEPSYTPLLGFGFVVAMSVGIVQKACRARRRSLSAKRAGKIDLDVDLSGLAASTITDLKTAERHAVKQWFQVSLPAFGYRFYKVEERGAPRLRYGAGDGVRTRDVQLGKQNVD